MSTSIDQSFVDQFESEVHTAYQRKGSLIRGTVRTKTGIIGKQTTFQKVGKGVASTKTRHGLVPVMNIDHTPVVCTLADHYAGDWVDKLDELKIQHDERTVTVEAGAMALGRKTDDIIITNALALATNQIAVGIQNDRSSGADTGMNVGKVLDAIQVLAERDVPVGDGQLWGILAPLAWTELLEFDQFADADKVGSDLPFPGVNVMTMRSWAGITWYMHSGLPKASTVRSCFVYHKPSIGHAIGQDVTVDIDWDGPHAAHFVDNMMSQGACLIDDDGVQEILCEE